VAFFWFCKLPVEATSALASSSGSSAAVPETTQRYFFRPFIHFAGFPGTATATGQTGKEGVFIRPSSQSPNKIVLSNKGGLVHSETAVVQ
jgi:hypothetical protein